MSIKLQNRVILACLALSSIGFVTPNVAQATPLFYGYYASARQNIGSGDYTQEISNHANTTWIGDVNVLPKLQEAQALKMKAVLDVQTLFFDDSYNLLPNYQQNWDAFALSVKAYQNTIVAFYPLDEPYLYSHREGMPYQTMLNTLTTIGAAIKKTFPTIAVAMLFTTNEFGYWYTGSIGSLMPANYDWFGMDCYGAFDNCRGQSIPQYYAKIQAALKPNQKMILIPDGLIQSDVATDQDQSALVGRAQGYQTLALSNSSIVGVFPFIWQTYQENGGTMTGIRDMPLVKDFYTSFGKQVLQAIRP